MNILLIEDDLHKGDKIFSFLSNKRETLEIDVARSYQSGLKKIFTRKYDLILLDMSLPVYERKAGESGFDAPSFAGEEILDEMKRKKVRAKVVVITQFETFGEGTNLVTLQELTKRLHEQFPETFMQTIHFSPGDNTWAKQLESLFAAL